MIKLFMKIRYNHMETRRTFKYLKYTIVEFILVSIGILKAHQIITWSQNTSNANEESKMLNQPLAETQGNVSSLKNGSNA
jgi:hypothetical protein